MARLSVFSLKVATGAVEGLADRLSTLRPESIGALTVDAVNDTADFAYALGRKHMLQGINLADAYVQRKMNVEYATLKNPRAEIVAYGGKGFTTALSHYGGMQLTEKVNWSNARIQAAGHKFGKWPGWTRRTGSTALGIAADTKASGKSVEVTRGSRKRIGPAFSIPGRKDNEGNLLLFRRAESGGKLQALQGPSVYQLFRVAIPGMYDEVSEDLAQRVIDTAERALTKALS